MYIRKSIQKAFKNVKTLLSFLLISLIILAPSAPAQAMPALIHQDSAIETVTSGVTLEKITRFTTDGWLSINVLRADLTNPNVKIDTLTNPESIQKSITAQDAAAYRGAVAAVNGSYFLWQDQPGFIAPIGPIMERGILKTASTDFNASSDTMATIAVDKLNTALCGYWKTAMSLTAANGTVIPVARYNKSYYGYEDITIYDNYWSSSSFGTKYTDTKLVEMVVANGTVTEIRKSMPAAPIPKNGFVAISKNKGGESLISNFKVGDKVSFSITTAPDWQNLKTAVSGGAMLVSGGLIPAQFSHDPDGITQNNTKAHPRTAIGATKDGKGLVMVTVDGRQQSSIGLTMNDMAALMLELGAYNAINLDGGGSTTMVERTPGTDSLKVINSPSDGMQRKIATAVGVFSTAPQAPLAGLIISTADKNVFLGTSRQFTVKGYDTYFNPVSIDPSDVKWSVIGAKGSFTGGSLLAQSIGPAEVKAAVGNVSAILDINMLSAPVELMLDTAAIKMTIGSRRSFTVKGRNRNGYYASIDSRDVRWMAVGNIGSFSKDGVFTAAGGGTGYIDASVGKTHAYCAASVASEKTIPVDGFETPNGKFTSYPSDVKGSYEISGDVKHGGNSSGKLGYNFAPTEQTRAAYLVFPGSGIPLDGNTCKIGLWAYNTHTNPNWLAAEIYDSTGKKHLAYFKKALDWTGWRYVELPLDDIDHPARLTRIYIVQVAPVEDSGFVYLDDLCIKDSTYAEMPVNIPKNTVQTDTANRRTIYTATRDSFRFGVLGQSEEPGADTDKNKIIATFTDIINKYVDMAAIVGGSSHGSASALLKKPCIATGKGYKSTDIKSARLIQLDISKGGMRKSDPAQWKWFLSQLDSFAGSTLFIFMAKPPSSFDDSLEAGLFQDILTEYTQKTGKHIWVFCNSTSERCYIERGVKYVETAGYSAADLTGATRSQAKYVLVTVRGATVTYEFRTVIY